MLYIRKGPAPGLFINYAKSRGARFDDMPGIAKEALRTSLLEEQGYLCAYCMKPLRDSYKDVKIEHYEPRNEKNELDYGNLLAVCHGGEGSKPEAQTCDTKKGDAVLSINPQNKQHMEGIRYKGNGEICAETDTLQQDLDCTLNLNSTQLKASRKAALEALQGAVCNKFGKKGASKDWWARCLSMYSARENGHLRGYCGILVWYIQKKIRQTK